MKRIYLLILFLCSSMLVNSEEIRILYSDGTELVENVDSDITKFYVHNKSKEVTAIEGLDSLSNLNYVQLSFSDLINLQESTWKSMNKIETLSLAFCSINNFEFIRNLPNLKVFSFSEGVEIQNISNIDLINNPKLVYFEIHIPSIENCPKVINASSDFLYLIISADIQNQKTIKDMLKKAKKTSFKIFLRDEYREFIPPERRLNDYSDLLTRFKI